MTNEPTPGGADDDSPSEENAGLAPLADGSDANAAEANDDSAVSGSDAAADDASKTEDDALAGLSEVVHERLEEAQVLLILEAALQAANEPLTVDRCLKLFRRGELPVSDAETQRELIRRLLEAQVEAFAGRGVELKRVASGYRLQVRQDLSPWVSRLWEEKPPRYSRALLETLSLIAYRQPVTRGDIELVRGVAVSSNIIRTLQERGWIREVGHREVPGRPALYGTTREFLDYFNLRTLSELPPLEEIRELIEPVIVPEPEPDPATDAVVEGNAMEGDESVAGSGSEATAGPEDAEESDATVAAILTEQETEQEPVQEPVQETGTGIEDPLDAAEPAADTSVAQARASDTPADSVSTLASEDDDKPIPADPTLSGES